MFPAGTVNRTLDHGQGSDAFPGPEGFRGGRSVSGVAPTVTDVSTNAFNPTFDCRTDAAGGDPDATSPTLKAYHQLLWSKPLPGGGAWELVDTAPDGFLVARGGGISVAVGSDTAVPTWSTWKRMAALVAQFPADEVAGWDTATYAMGAMMLFPRTRIDGERTINQERGFNPLIGDRLDLTLECIRRHYGGESSPLDATLQRYSDFFALFRDFAGYVAFFLLEDLVTKDRAGVRFMLPFDDFASSPLPADADAYRGYITRALDFVQARNARMLDHVTTVTS